MTNKLPTEITWNGWILKREPQGTVWVCTVVKSPGWKLDFQLHLHDGSYLGEVICQVPGLHGKMIYQGPSDPDPHVAMEKALQKSQQVVDNLAHPIADLANGNRE